MNFDYARMKQICASPIKSFKDVGDVTKTINGIYVYKDNPKAKILGIAHLDTVLSLKHFHKINIKGDDLIFNAQLDDRLGVYVLLDVLPKMGIEFDLLLTEGEESGLSTAMHFDPPKDYNWMFSFDRRGDDVVMYQYDSDDMRLRLKKSGFIPSIGSFSDIAFLDHLGIKGINIGTGYEGEHSDYCYANMTVLRQQIKRFHDFYKHNKDTRLPHTITSTGYSAFRHEWSSYDDLYCYLCSKTRGKTEVMDGVYLCDGCLNEAGQCTVCDDIYYEYELTDGICPDCIDLG